MICGPIIQTLTDSAIHLKYCLGYPVRRRTAVARLRRWLTASPSASRSERRTSASAHRRLACSPHRKPLPSCRLHCRAGSHLSRRDRRFPVRSRRLRALGSGANRKRGHFAAVSSDSSASNRAWSRRAQRLTRLPPRARSPLLDFTLTVLGKKEAGPFGTGLIPSP